MNGFRIGRTLYIALAAWIVLLIAISISPLSFKLRLHTIGPLHVFAHFVAFLLTAILLSLVTRRWWPRTLAVIVATYFAYAQEWTENRIYHAGFEWRDVQIDWTGLVFGFILILLVEDVVRGDA